MDTTQTQQLTAGLSVAVRVPASSANLGPGFDTLGLALGIYDEIDVSTTNSGLIVEVEGDGSVPRDETHLVVRAIRSGLKFRGVDAPGLHVLCRNKIPHSRGLGSSASAVVAGVAAASGLLEASGRQKLSAAEMIQLSSTFEGHPDNASASVLGRAVVSWSERVDADFTRYQAARIDIHSALRATVFVPSIESSTCQTRGLLPAEVPHEDAAFNVSRSALMTLALRSRHDLLLTATDDRLHQNYRRVAMPSSAALVDRLRERGIAAMISGAGPTVLALHVTSLEHLEADGFEVCSVDIAEGVTVAATS